MSYPKSDQVDTITRCFAACTSDMDKREAAAVIIKLMEESDVEDLVFDDLNVKNQLRGLPWG